ncbi:tetratricopeptide repeat protein [Spirulina sp. CS-785/01]|uniref:tetratricopeptide repeat protein n=1 Tax=Spirulina sp. CS-785/01 TaxID=3021716 RepID=UPI00232D5AEE|nr:tetratricopeptide repeat protein [Spirulina sp. CS-785/01]MDB9312751.1 tetratricopeptide repeat protein [Spirulina sp. CS-785/01]
MGVCHSLGSLDQALEQYSVAAQDGTPEALNNIGHIYIHRFNPAKRRNTPIVAETFLRLGVQRITEDTPRVTQYILHRNLGWSLVAQKQYEEAENYLTDSIEIYDQLDDEETQQIAMASECLLTQVYEAQDRPVSDLNPLYQDCIDRSLPQTTDQYKWLLGVGERRLAACMDTSKIVENPNPAPMETNPLCGEPMVMAPPTVSQPEEIENLRVGLSDTLNSSWTQVPTFSEPVSYVVTVNSEGTVIEYEPIGDAAGQYDDETPLPGLVEETDNETAIVNFQVTFNSNESYDVSYLESENTDESSEAE